MSERIAVYIDGFNLYHAIDDLKKPHLKWVNLRSLAEKLIRPRDQNVSLVYYCSAYANYYSGTPDVGKLLRHRSYVAALESVGVEPEMGNFAKRYWYFSAKSYKARWRRHEEKQTDVNIGVLAVRDAFLDRFDAAYFVSCDTDLLPIYRILKKEFPQKRLACVAPPQRSHHRDLLRASDDHLVIKESQIEKSLFSAVVLDLAGKIVAERPPEYTPPMLA